MLSSFFIAGFEGTAAYNVHGDWIDHVVATAHDRHVDDDYARLTAVGIRAAREATRWPLIDRGHGRYDFSSLDPFVTAAQRHGIDVLWDLFHYGYPVDTDPFSAGFAARFSDYAIAVAKHLRQRGLQPLRLVPVSEPSSFAWAAGDQALFAPHARGRGPELKRCLIRAAIVAMRCIRDVDRDAVFIHPDPLVHRRPLLADAETPPATAEDDQDRWEAWDMIAGRSEPSLGGSRDLLDVVAVSYSANNPVEADREQDPPDTDDPRRPRLRDLVAAAYDRYGADILLGETPSGGEERGTWLAAMVDECEALVDGGVPLRGICLHPILGMPDWHDQQRWLQVGLWDVDVDDPDKPRRLNASMAEALLKGQRLEEAVARAQV